MFLAVLVAIALNIDEVNTNEHTKVVISDDAIHTSSCQLLCQVNAPNMPLFKDYSKCFNNFSLFFSKSDLN